MRKKPGRTAKKADRLDLKQIENKIKSIIAEVLEVDVKRITSKARFAEDLGMDSMRALEILAAIEKTYRIEIPEEALPKIVSFDEVVKLTKERPESGVDQRKSM